ncbi:MAG: hypothetical protein QG618_25, partial [Thermodesulfobacteriota bacterium]|nr:hypothetical protein [Thermodesulfobacteriota bacterium]
CGEIGMTMPHITYGNAGQKIGIYISLIVIKFAAPTFDKGPPLTQIGLKHMILGKLNAHYFISLIIKLFGKQLGAYP